MKKKRIVLNDKDKIASVIKELDEKKNEALRNAWKKVNKVNGLFQLTKFRTMHLRYSSSLLAASFFFSSKGN